MKVRVYFIITMTVVSIVSCKSKQQNVQNAQQNLRAAKHDIQNANNDLNNQYPGFKEEEEREINENENRIEELKRIVNTDDKPIDANHAWHIQQLEDRNAELRSRLYGYGNARSDGRTFKSDFKSDMD